jgi:hypothetical protein
MPTPQIKIISGGQTGVDRGALDAALAAGAPCGGWCPAGRRAEDGPIDDVYPLEETESDKYIVRTRQNVIDSDATLVIFFNALEGGTARTVEFCRALHRPCYQLDANQFSSREAAQLIKNFIEDNHVRVLNVAGPRASKQPRAHSYSQQLIGLILSSDSLNTFATGHE